MEKEEKHKHVYQLATAENNGKCSVCKKKNKIIKGEKICICLKPIKNDQSNICRALACPKCFQKYDFLRDLESKLLIEIIKKGQLCQQEQLDYQ